VSWKPQPGAYALNAFTLNWGLWKAFIFPPFSLIFRACKKSEKKEQQLFLFTQFGQVSPGTRYC
jgi:hypothetical protein